MAAPGRRGCATPGPDAAIRRWWHLEFGIQSARFEKERDAKPLGPGVRRGRGDARGRRLRTDGRPEIRGPGRPGPRRARQAAALPQRPSKGPTTMADGGIQQMLAELGATVRVDEARLTRGGRHRVRRLEEARHGARPLRRHRGQERARRLLHRRPAGDVSVDARARRRTAALGTDARSRSRSACSGSTRIPTSTRPRRRAADRSAACRSRSRPAARCRCMRLDARLDPPLADRHVVMGGVRLTDPLEQRLLDESRIEQLSVDDLRNSDAGGVGAARSPRTASPTRSTSTSTWTCSIRAR